MKSDGQQFVEFACLHYSTQAAFMNILFKIDTFSFWINFLYTVFFMSTFSGRLCLLLLLLRLRADRGSSWPYSSYYIAGTISPVEPLIY